MIYLTGDMHGDFGLLWKKDREFQYNLKWLSNRVDYVITHCMSGSMQRDLECYYIRKDLPERVFENDILTDYFDELEQKLQYKYWFCGHYHVNIQLNTKHRYFMRMWCR